MKKLKNTHLIIFILSFFFANFFLNNNSFANISIIRESETEQFLKEICEPIFKVAGLDTRGIRIYIVNDSAINAFVMGGQNIFVNTGLINKFSNPNVLSGVIAHEVGHIASGHLAKSNEVYTNNANATIIGYILGIGAMASGRADVGSALILGSAHVGSRLALKYNRAQEESADILALEYLKKLNIPYSGLLEIMEYFNQQNKGFDQNINIYELTHPISSSRITLIKNYQKNLPQKSPNNKIVTHKLMKLQAKLKGFLEDPGSTLKQKLNLNDEYSLLTKAIIYHRLLDYPKSLKILDNLIKNNPTDGFLYELKAEFLFSQSNLVEAIINFRKAINLLNEDSKTLAQINIANAIIQLDTNDEFLLNLGKNYLLDALRKEVDNELIYKNLAQIYSLQKQQAKSLLAMAEYFYLTEEYEKAEKLANEALSTFEKCQKNCPYDYDKFSIIRAKDLIAITANLKNKNNSKN